MAWKSWETLPDEIIKNGTRILTGRRTGDPNAMNEGLIKVDRYFPPKEGRGWHGWSQWSMTYWPPTHWDYISDLPEPP